MRFDSPLGPPRLKAPAVPETWPRALLGYHLFVVARWAVGLAAASEPPDIQAIVWANFMVFVSSVSVIVINGILWFYLASLFLGAAASISNSIRIVGNAFFHPAVVQTVLFFIIVLLRLGGSLHDSERLAQSGPFGIIIWALVNVVRAAKRTNSFGAAQVVMFVLWGCGLVFLTNSFWRSF